MSVSELNYRFTAVRPRVVTEPDPVPTPVQSTKTPNRKSLAKKAWWAKKKAEEAAR